MGNLAIKNDSFIQSMHNDIQCIESLDPNDKGTSRQYWFSASMLANIFDIALNTVKNNVDFLVKWGEVTIVKNLTIVQTQNSVGAVKDTTLYDLQVFNKLAMQLRTDAAMEIRNKFSDILDALILFSYKFRVYCLESLNRITFYSSKFFIINFFYL